MTDKTFVKLYRESVDYLTGQKRSLVVRALAAYDVANSVAHVTQRQLDPLMKAATCDYIRVWEIGTHLLHMLAPHHPAALDCLRTMLTHNKATIRFRVVVYLRFSSLSKSTVREFLALALRDKSYDVRGTAADIAGRRILTEMLPALRSAHQHEKHPLTRKHLSFTIGMIEDGYVLRRENETPAIIYVHLHHKDLYWKSMPIAEEHLAPRRLKSFIRRQRASPWD